MTNYLNPALDERKAVIAAAMPIFKARFFNPGLNGLDLDAELETRMQSLLETPDFPSAMQGLFGATNARPIDFFYEPERRLSLERLLKATLFVTNDGRFMFRDVLVGGRAEEAGIIPGELLISINDQRPVAKCMVHAHRPFTIAVEGRSGRAENLSFGPPSSWKPRTEKNVAYKEIASGIGHIRIAAWPGILGIDVARETDAAIKRLNAKRLIVDLRGNLGSAGAGNLRLMSYLTPERIPVGYSLTRRRAEDGYNREDLPRFEKIPKFKVQGIFPLLKFRKLDKSIVVVTEGLGRREFHGRITLLVDQHTISGAEIVTHFAKQHSLAKIVGEATAGRSLSYGTFPLPYDFKITFPIGDYVPWFGDRFEETGIAPDVLVPFQWPVRPGLDPQLEEAVRLAA
jgi:carboxyl-terminal processing protease